MTEAKQQSEAPARIVAVIDIGSNSVRMVIAQVLPDGQIETLERMHRAVRLGQDTFVHGRLGQETMNASCAILRDYKRVLETYQVRQVRAVATSAVREAANADAFLDRVYLTTSLDVEIIEAAEESRLTVSAVRRALEGVTGPRRGYTLIADVGGGSSLLTLLHDDRVEQSGAYRMGSIRLQEQLSTQQEPAERAADLLRHQIASGVASIEAAMPLGKVRTFVAVGGDARFAARQIGRPHKKCEDLSVVDVTAFDELVRRCAGHTAEELVKIFALPFADAETLVPALLTFQLLLHQTHAKEILVSDTSMRDGLLLDQARLITGEEDTAYAESVLQSARSIGEKYHYDAPHAEHVGDLAVRLFDALREEHGLGRRHRLLLRVAAVLHDIGAFVSNRAHHKHTYYLVNNSEVFGLRREDQAIVSHVARYHRRGVPKPTHVEYMSLPRDRRMEISKLAALLRVADALDHSHSQQIREIELERLSDELVISVRGVSDLALERRAMAVKSDLFEDLYGLRLRLEEADLHTPRRGRAESIE